MQSISFVRRHWIVVCLGVLVLGTGLAITLIPNGAGTQTTEADAGSGATLGADSPSGAPRVSSPSGTPGSGSPSGDPPSAATSGPSGAAGPGPTAEPGDASPSATDAGSPELHPTASPSPRPSIAALLEGDIVAGHLTSVPESGNVEGRLTDGFPQDVVAVAPQSSVVAAGVSSSDDRAHITLRATTAAATSQVLEFYRAWFLGGGFVEKPADAAPGTTALTFTRDDGMVAISVDDRDGTTGFALIALLTVTP